MLLRPIFAPKMKIAPATVGLVSRNCEGLAVIRTRKVKFIFFGPHLKLVRKTVSILVKTFFCFFFEIT